jgi:hypothetical protein
VAARVHEHRVDDARPGPQSGSILMAADLRGATLTGTRLLHGVWDHSTFWPPGYQPYKARRAGSAEHRTSPLASQETASQQSSLPLSLDQHYRGGP